MKNKDKKLNQDKNFTPDKKFNPMDFDHIDNFFAFLIVIGGFLLYHYFGS